MKIVSLNCWGISDNQARFRTLAEELRQLDADVLCLQEVIFPRQAQLLDQVFHKIGYHTFYRMARLGLVIQGGLYTAVRLGSQDSVEVGHNTYARQVNGSQILSLSDWFLKKGWLSVRFDTGKGLLNVVNTHLVANYGKELYGRLPAHTQLQQLEKQIEAFEEPIILCGDFNLVPGNFLSASYIRNNLQEAFEWNEKPYTVDNFRNDLRNGKSNELSGRGVSYPSKRLDYIFWNHVNCAEARLIFVDPIQSSDYSGQLSDHYGVYVELSS